MATNRMMTDAEQTRIESIDERARINIWSGSQAIAASGGTNNFYSTLRLPISSAAYARFLVVGYETVSENDFEDDIRFDIGPYSSGPNVSIQSTLNNLTIRNDLAVEIHITSIYLYLN